MTDTDYKKAYERQKRAREKAEDLLEVRSRELYETNVTLMNAYNELKDQKSHLVQQEKLASIGLLSAGLAHEINNPVGFIKSNLQVLEDYLTLVNNLLINFQAAAKKVHRNPEEVNYQDELTHLIKLAQENDLAFVIADSLASIKESLAGTGRIQDIVTNLRDYSRADTTNSVECNINDIVSNAIKLLRNEIKYKITVETKFDELPLTYAHVGQLSQVFVNIILNAVQALSEKDTLTITTRNMGTHILIDFIDNGPGIASADLSKLFDPFFTTKDIGQGTGLGLYISHSLIQKHFGSIEVSNNAGGGAHFRIILPIQLTGGSAKLAPRK